MMGRGLPILLAVAGRAPVPQGVSAFASHSASRIVLPRGVVSMTTSSPKEETSASCLVFFLYEILQSMNKDELLALIREKVEMRNMNLTKASPEEMSNSSPPFTDEMLRSMTKDALIALHNEKAKMIQVLQRLKGQETIVPYKEGLLIPLVNTSEERIRVKERWIQILEEENKKLAEENKQLLLELSYKKAEYKTEWNLRPVMELEVCNWCKFMRLKYSNTTEARSNLFYTGLCVPQHPNKSEYLEDDRELFAHCFNDTIKLSKAAGVNETRARDEIKNVFSSLPKKHYYKGAVVPPGVTGFILANHDMDISAGISVMLMYFQIDHTVMSKDFEEVLYEWPHDIL